MNNRLDADNLTLIDVSDLFLHRCGPRKHAENLAHRAHLFEALHLFQEVSQCEVLARCEFGFHRFDLIATDCTFGLFGKRCHISHAKNSLRHALWIEEIEVGKFFATRCKHDGLTDN